MAKTRIEFLHHQGDHVPGDIAAVDAELAANLVRAGRAKLATAGKPKAAAKKRPRSNAAKKASSSPATATDPSHVDDGDE